MARELVPCPSEAAYRRHTRRREIACEGCLKAHAEYEAKQYWARKTGRAA